MRSSFYDIDKWRRQVAPLDPRLTPLVALRQELPLPDHDHEEQAERHELRKLEIREAVRK